MTDPHPLTSESPAMSERVSSKTCRALVATDAFLSHLLTRDDAVILNVTSALAFVPWPVTPTYNATKAALHSISESLRVQLADTPVQVIEVVPPGVRTTLMGS